MNQHNLPRYGGTIHENLTQLATAQQRADLATYVGFVERWQADMHHRMQRWATQWLEPGYDPYNSVDRPARMWKGIDIARGNDTTKVWWDEAGAVRYRK